MTTREITVRQYLSEGAHEDIPLEISWDEHMISYGIHITHDCDTREADTKIDLTEDLEDAIAAIHSYNKCVCLEAFSDKVFVQTIPMGFDGTLDGRMNVRTRDINGYRNLCQISPGQSIWAESATLAVLPNQLAQVAPLHDSCVERVSQAQIASQHEEDLLIATDSPVPAPKPTSTAMALAGFNAFSPRKTVRFASPGCEEPDRCRSTDTTLINASPERSTADDSVGCGMFELATHEQPAALVGPDNEKANALDSEIYREPGTSTHQRLPMIAVALSPVPLSPTAIISLKRSYPEDDPESQESLKGSIHVNKTVRRTNEDDGKATELHGQDCSHDDQSGMTPDAHERSTPKSKSKSPRSRESTRRSHSASPTHKSPVPKLNDIRLVFASSTIVDKSAYFLNFLLKNGVEIVTSIPDCTALVVGKGALKKTAKLLMAVQLGKDIVSDTWVTKSAKAGSLKSINEYQARDDVREIEWGISLKAAIARGKAGTRPLDGWSVIFTQAAKNEVGKSGFANLQEVATTAGASRVTTLVPKGPSWETPLTIIICSGDDPAFAKIHASWRGFSREIIGITILRGVLDTESDEFLVQRPEVKT